MWWTRPTFVCVAIATLCLTLVSNVTASFTVTSAGNVTVLEGDTASFVFAIQPWPPQCPCSEQDAHGNVTLHFFNVTAGNRLLCDVIYYNGAFVNGTTGRCSAYEPRMADYGGGSSKGASFQLTLTSPYDMTIYGLVLTYIPWPPLNLSINATTPIPTPGPAPDPVHVTAFTGLTVHMLPPAPDVWATPNDTLTENEVVTMECRVTRANPPAELVWKYDGYMVVTPTSYTPATSWMDTTISIISITASRHDHGRTYTCYAHNTLNVNTPISSSISLSVLYAPYVELGPCYSDGVKYDVIEGQSASFTCQIEANPEALLLWWYSKSGSTGIETLVDGPTARTTLSVTGVTRNMTSTLYGCETNNTEGVSARRYCQLNVLYSPSISLEVPPPANEGDNVSVTCYADANPPVTQYMWTKSPHNAVVANTQMLTIVNIQLDGAANYTCHATNGVNGLIPDQRTVAIWVKCQPRWVQYALKKFTGHESEPAEVVCALQAYPGVTFRWLHDNVEVVSGVGGWTVVSDADTSTLYVASTSATHRGLYECQATNTEGSATFSLYLLEPGIPDKPQHCVTVNVTATSAAIECVPGWDGGDGQASVKYPVKDGGGVTHASTAFYNGHVAVISVSGLQPLTSYHMLVYAANSHGWSSDAFPLTLHTIEGQLVPLPTPGPNVGPVIGAIIGIVLAVTLLVGAALICYLRYEPKKPTDEDIKEETDTNDADNVNSDDEAGFQRQRTSEPMSTGQLTARNTLLNKYAYRDDINAKPGTNKMPAPPLHASQNIYNGPPPSFHSQSRDHLNQNMYTDRPRPTSLVGQSRAQSQELYSSPRQQQLGHYSTSMSTHSLPQSVQNLPASDDYWQQYQARKQRSRQNHDVPYLDNSSGDVRNDRMYGDANYDRQREQRGNRKSVGFSDGVNNSNYNSTYVRQLSNSQSTDKLLRQASDDHNYSQQRSKTALSNSSLDGANSSSGYYSQNSAQYLQSQGQGHDRLGFNPSSAYSERSAQYQRDASRPQGQGYGAYNASPTSSSGSSDRGLPDEQKPMFKHHQQRGGDNTTALPPPRHKRAHDNLAFTADNYNNIVPQSSNANYYTSRTQLAQPYPTQSVVGTASNRIVVQADVHQHRNDRVSSPSNASQYYNNNSQQRTDASSAKRSKYADTRQPQSFELQDFGTASTQYGYGQQHRAYGNHGNNYNADQTFNSGRHAYQQPTTTKLLATANGISVPTSQQPIGTAKMLASSNGISPPPSKMLASANGQTPAPLHNATALQAPPRQRKSAARPAESSRVQQWDS